MSTTSTAFYQPTAEALAMMSAERQQFYAAKAVEDAKFLAWAERHAKRPSIRDIIAALPPFVPPAPKPGFRVVAVRADDVKVGDWHIPMEGTDLPVGKGRTWRRCNEKTDPIGSGIAISWGNTHRWYKVDQPVFVLRPEAESSR